MRAYSREFFLYLLMILLSALFIFLDTKELTKPIRTSVQSILLPLQKNVSLIRLSGEGIFSSKLVLKDNQIQKLTEEKAVLQARILQLASVEEENKQVRRLLGADLPVGWRLSPARVVGKIADELLLIGDYTPKLDEIVLVTQEDSSWKSGVYVGRVEKQIGSTVSLLLPSSPKSRVGVTVRGKDGLGKRATGILEGKGGRVLLDQVLLTESLSEGDFVLVNGVGLDLGLNEELLLGSISKVLTSNNSFKQAEVQLVINPEKLDLVFYLTKNK